MGQRMELGKDRKRGLIAGIGRGLLTGIGRMIKGADSWG